MTSRIVFLLCMLLCVSDLVFADEDKKKCTKMEGRTDLKATTLRKQLLCNYDKHSAPVNASADNRVYVEAMLFLYRAEFEYSDDQTPISIMLYDSPNWFVVSTYVFMAWTDPRLNWNATEHNNITRTFFDSNEIWTPDTDINTGRETIFVLNEGKVINAFWTQLVGNCKPINFDWGDQRECILSFRVQPDDKLQLQRWDDEYQWEESHTSNSATWTVAKVKKIYPLKKGETNEQFAKIHEETSWKYGPGYFETKFIIQRNSAVQDATIFAPAAILAILMISTTWIAPTNVSRIALLSMIIVIQVFMFHRANHSMPFLPTKVVDIVQLYQELIICSGAAVIEWLIAYNIATEKATFKERLNVMPKPSLFTLLKSVFVISDKGSKYVEMAALLDRITFLVLSAISFILVVLAKRPPIVTKVEIDL